MRRTAFASAIAGLALLAGCDGSTEPSPPPTTEDALTTATAQPAATTEEPTGSDESAVTTEAAPTTQSPTAEDGPPEMPEEAREHSQEGAVAFAEYFVDIVNYTGIHPIPGLISGLSSNTCATCSNLEETVVHSLESGEFVDGDAWEITGDSTVLVFGEAQAVVRVPLTEHVVSIMDADGRQIDESAGGNYDMAIDLVWDEGWQARAVGFE